MPISQASSRWAVIGAMVLAATLVAVAVVASLGAPAQRIASASSPRAPARAEVRPPTASGAYAGRERGPDRAMLAVVAAGAPPQRGTSVASTSPGATVPTRSALAATRRYIGDRRGVTSFAVVDSGGAEGGHNASVPFPSASVVKAMLLVGYLRGARDRPLSAGERAVLGAMIKSSNNAAATRIFASQGPPGLRRVARAAGMRRFSVGPTWTSAIITARDQARLFARLDRVLPGRHRDYGRGLLSSVVASQSWGIPAGAPPGWRAYFKGGWRPTVRGRLVHQVARLEAGERTVVIAVLTDGNPSHGYGTTTIRQVARRLLAEPAKGGGPARSELSKAAGSVGR